MKAMLFEDYRDNFQIEVPLTSKVDVTRLRQELGILEYVDVQDYVMRRLVATTWAARNISLVYEQVPNDVRKNLAGKPMDIAFFGGAAFRLVCRSSNKPGPFYRNINDLDIVTTSQRGNDLVMLLSSLSHAFGTEYYHFITTSDRFFNNAMRPKRFRIHAINGLQDGNPVAGEMDIFADKIAMCHTIDVREEVERSSELLHTIGIEKLLLTKLQFVKKVPKQVIDASNNYRIIEQFDADSVVIGLEDKDFLDVSSAFYDHDVGEAMGQIRTQTTYNVLKKDAGLCKTVSLNLQNVLNNIGRLNLPPAYVSVIEDRIRRLMKELPEAKTKFLGGLKKQWWATVED